MKRYGPDSVQCANGPRAMYVVATAINREMPPNQLESIHLPQIELWTPTSSWCSRKVAAVLFMNIIRADIDHCLGDFLLCYIVKDIFRKCECTKIKKKFHTIKDGRNTIV
jgi:hypothetical protein